MEEKPETETNRYNFNRVIRLLLFLEFTFTSFFRLGACDVCGGHNAAKYCCPRCQTKTCGLQCVQKHKQVLKCSGQRDRTKYVGADQFTDLDLLSGDIILIDLINGLIINEKW